jgi:hypothetical protein
MLAAMLAAGVGGCASTPREQYFQQARVLNDEMVAKVRPDMSREQVREILGTPARIGQDRVTRHEEWMWRYTRLNFRDMCVYVRFYETGRVAGVSTALETEGADFYKPC